MWVRRFTRFVNDVLYEFNSTATSTGARYEPVNLHVFVPVNTANVPRLWQGQQLFVKTLRPEPWNLSGENFHFALSQLPALETIEFSGWGDPC